MRLLTLTLLSATLLLSACVSETTYNGDIKKLIDTPDHGHVVVTGEVGEVYGRDEFILRDKTDSVEVFERAPYVHVHTGEHVTVEGDVQSSTFENIIGERKDIEANQVTVSG